MASPVTPLPLLELSAPPTVVADPLRVQLAAERLGAGRGPVAVDAERASGYRYGQRAYLLQFRREGAGTWLVDPLAAGELGALAGALADCTWVLHAASQDLPCLAELGLAPTRLFDTELAARLAGFERVGLAAVCERLLGVHLEKGFSAADWSTRPLPEPWLRYAALDVEVLTDLQAALRAELAEQGKLGWAEEEFAAVLAAPAPAERAEPWRRVSGVHQVHGGRRLAIVRSLWQARDQLARRRDLAPGRVLPDAVIVAAARSQPESLARLAALPGLQGPRIRRTVPYWWAAIEEALRLDEADLPQAAPAQGGPPPASRWAERDPQAAARLSRVRAALAELAGQHRLPVENLLEPALTRQLAWRPPQVTDGPEVAAALSAGGARRWQVELTAGVLAAALAG